MRGQRFLCCGGKADGNAMCLVREPLPGQRRDPSIFNDSWSPLSGGSREQLGPNDLSLPEQLVPSVPAVSMWISAQLQRYSGAYRSSRNWQGAKHHPPQQKPGQSPTPSPPVAVTGRKWFPQPTAGEARGVSGAETHTQQHQCQLWGPASTPATTVTVLEWSPTPSRQ